MDLVEVRIMRVMHDGNGFCEVEVVVEGSLRHIATSHALSDQDRVLVDPDTNRMYDHDGNELTLIR